MSRLPFSRRPGKVIAVGLNYRQHASEADVDVRPAGPAVVPAAEIADPQALAIRARLNGQVMQDASTSQMIHGVADLITFLSHGMTLEAGDVIATGTPSGVGAFRDPPVFLRPGDQIEIEIEGIGVLSNPVVAC